MIPLAMFSNFAGRKEDEVGTRKYREPAKQKLERKNYRGGNNTIRCHGDFLGTIYLPGKCSGVFGHW
jgi:hypothetical protein